MRFVTWGIGLLLLILLAAGVWFGSYLLTPSPAAEDTIVFIPKGTSVRGIKTLLAREGLIKDDIRFLALARITGTAKRLRAGEYLIPAYQKPLQILRILEKGKVVQHQVTIPEGLTVRQVAALFGEENWVDPQRFVELTKDQEFIHSLGLELESIEGYLFPDTYMLTRGEVSEESVITMMVGRFFEIWQDSTADLATNQIRHQVVTLASIVEKETGSPEERPLIARVFLNRLEKNMRLQSDPTVIYGMDDFTGNLTRKDLVRKTPYNTYIIKGLPPGPICNPGRESILAVLHPADAPFLYFVSKNDGTHHFSTNLREHNSAVRKYQRQKSSRENSNTKNSGEAEKKI